MRARRPARRSASSTGAAEAGLTQAPVRIERLATGGEGVGRMADGRTVFVPRSAPGDLCDLRDVRLHPRLARARIARLVEPGPGRAAPRCLHYVAHDCGGCQLQHLSAGAQLEAKRTFVQDALTRIARLAIPVPPVVAAGSPWAYRHRVTLALGPGRRYAGFHPLDRPGAVFPLEQCEIAAPPLMQLWQALRPHLHLLPPDAERLVLRLDRDGGRHLLVRARGTSAWTGERLLVRLQLPVTVWWQPEHGAARVVAGRREAFPATVFEQVHPGLGDRIRALVLELLGDLRGAHVWDLFAGIGETTDLLRAAGATVESVELDRRAVEEAERRAAPPGVAAGTVVRHVGRVEELAPRLHLPEAVVANPPRAGMEREVTDALRVRRPRRLVYQSCDPATLARDLARLVEPAGPGAPGPFQVVHVQPFDLFPQTAHVETVVLLEAAA